MDDLLAVRTKPPNLRRQLDRILVNCAYIVLCCVSMPYCIVAEKLILYALILFSVDIDLVDVTDEALTS